MSVTQVASLLRARPATVRNWQRVGWITDLEPGRILRGIGLAPNEVEGILCGRDELLRPFEVRSIFVLSGTALKEWVDGDLLRYGDLPRNDGHHYRVFLRSGVMRALVQGGLDDARAETVVTGTDRLLVREDVVAARGLVWWKLGVELSLSHGIQAVRLPSGRWRYLASTVYAPNSVPT